MHITHTNRLSHRETDALQCLTAQCRLKDSLTLSFPGDGDDYWILEHDNHAPGAYIAVCRIDEGLWECYAFTHPGFRGRGYFSKLLEQVCDFSQKNGDPVLALVTDRRCPQALEILEHLEANFSYSEFMMCYPLSHCSETENPGGDMVLKFNTEPFARREGDWEKAEAESPVTVAAWPASSPPSAPPVVNCRMLVHGSKLYLYSLNTLPAYRRRGMAYRFLLQLIQTLCGTAYDTLCLQVSGTNEAALNLYKKTGFHITESLSYYLY